jgi:ElaA protein
MPYWINKLYSELVIQELYALLKLRQDVFSLEQNCLYSDIDDLDQYCHHLMLVGKDGLQAYLRCLPPQLHYKESVIGRVVVTPQARGKQLGRELMKRGIAFSFKRYPDANIRISAQLHLKDFYQSLNFEPVGDPYDEDGISHISMRLHRQNT